MIDSFHTLLERNYALRPVWLTIFPDRIVHSIIRRRNICKYCTVISMADIGLPLRHKNYYIYIYICVILYDFHECSHNANTKYEWGHSSFCGQIISLSWLSTIQVFPEVQSQGDGYNCGPMVAIATSILFGINPCIVTYDRFLLRPHIR